MTRDELERLRSTGTQDERELLERASREHVSVPAELRRQVLHGIDARLARRRRRPLVLALAVTLAAGSAVAAGLVQSRRPLADRPLPVTAVAAETPQRPRPPVAEVRVPVRRQQSQARPAARPPLAPDWRPGLPPAEDAPPTAPPAPRLVIAREGEPEVSLVLAAGQVVGTVRGTPVALALDGGRLTGKLGARNVWLWLHGHEAGGEIGGIPVRFELVEVEGGHELREGYSVRTALPPGAARVALVSGSLTWSPSCGAPLPQVAPDTYEGPCASGRSARVVVPAAWSRLPPLAGAILLSFFLTERDPSFARLFE